MTRLWERAAALLAAVIGAMAVVAGGKVLLGEDPGYHVINWVPVYNYTVGVLTLVLTAVLLWRGHPLARWFVATTLAAHATVFVLLQTAYRAEVAPDSVRAMTVRIVVWLAIVALLVVAARSRPRAAAPVPG